MLFSSTECCVQQRAIREKGNKTARMKFNEPRILFHFPPITTALKFHAHQQGEKLRIKKKRSSSSADNREKIGRHITRSSIISCGFVLHNVSPPPPCWAFVFPFGRRTWDVEALVIFLLLFLFLIHRFRYVDCCTSGVQLLLTSFLHILLESERRWNERVVCFRSKKTTREIKLYIKSCNSAIS